MQTLVRPKEMPGLPYGGIDWLTSDGNNRITFMTTAVSVMALPEASTWAMMIAGFDADGDGKVTRAEFDAGLKRSFDAVDTRRQGWLGYIAYSDWQERWMGDRNTVPSPFEVDRDGDNKLSFAEIAERFDLLFTRFDADKNGVIERKELVTIRPQMGPPGGQRGKKGARPN